jgi:hypothetical protein
MTHRTSKQIVPIMREGVRFTVFASEITHADTIDWGDGEITDYYEAFAIVCGEPWAIWTSCEHNAPMETSHTWHLAYKLEGHTK